MIFKIAVDERNLGGIWAEWLPYNASVPIRAIEVFRENGLIGHVADPRSISAKGNLARDRLNARGLFLRLGKQFRLGSVYCIPNEDDARAWS